MSKTQTPQPSTISYHPFVESHSEGVMNLLQHSFRVGEPLEVAMEITEEECGPWFAIVMADALKDGISYVAVDDATGRVIGCRLSTTQNRSSDPPELPDMASFPNTQKLLDVLEFIEAIEGNKWDTLPQSVNKLLKFEIVSVEESYRRQGIAQKMIDLSLERAKAEEFDAVAVIASSFKTQIMFREKRGFTTLKTVSLREYRSSSGNLIFEKVPDDNLVADFMVKLLKVV